jgi:hypothetical protein
VCLWPDFAQAAASIGGDQEVVALRQIRWFGALCSIGALLAGAGWVARPAGAIIGGTLDGKTHRSVGFVLEPSTQSSCSGALVKTRAPYDKVVLTAAHCFPSGTQVVVAFDSTISQFGSTWYSGVVYDDPNFNITGTDLGQNDDHDIAVVVFTATVPELPPYALAPVGSNKIGTSYTSVGYGLTDPYGFGVGTRYYGTFQSTYQDPWYLGSSPTCEGDSGGPALVRIRNKDYVAGLTDFGGAACSTGYEYRVDTTGAQAFINGGFLATN